MKSTSPRAVELAGWLRSHRPRATALRRAVDALFPPLCLFCREPGDLGALDLCSYCLAALPLAGPTASRRVAVFDYAAPVDSQIKRLKYSGEQAVARVLGAVLAADRALAVAPVDALVPVPLHLSRLRERGFNQAAHIAAATGAWLGLPVLSSLVARTRPTRSQAGLRAAVRRANVARAFSLMPRQAERLPRSLRLALVDDVLTTGATFAAAAQPLRSAGFVVQQYWALARAAYVAPDGRGSAAESANLTHARALLGGS